MSDPIVNLRHIPFFEAASRAERESAEFKSATAGLVTLRLVDAWLGTAARSAFLADGWSVPAVRSAIDEVEVSHSVRNALHGIVDVMTSPKSGLRSLAPKLMAFGHLLEYSADWTLAADVYGTIVQHAHPFEEAELATQAHLRNGFCLRQLGLLEPSLEAYRTAGAIAMKSGDLVGVLRSRIGEAKGAISRGNLPHADEILKAAAEQARDAQLSDVESMALHDRADVAHRRGDYELAVEFAYEALERTNSPRERDRILGDLATSFRMLGLRSAAHDAYIILAATAQEQYGRWAATLNLMELASDQGQEVLFEQFRRSMEASDLPVQLRVHYWRISGVGTARFGNADDARVLLERAIALAEENELNQFAFDARERLADVLAATKAESTEKSWAPVSAAVDQIARKIQQQRAEVVQ